MKYLTGMESGTRTEVQDLKTLTSDMSFSAFDLLPPMIFTISTAFVSWRFTILTNISDVETAISVGGWSYRSFVHIATINAM